MSQVNWNKVAVGYDSQCMQLNSYLNHCKSVTNIRSKPAPMKKSIETQKYAELMKKSRGIANEYSNKCYDVKIRRENQHL